MGGVTNCVNCGAPIDLNEKACPYCGTLYYPARVTSDRFDMDLNYRLAYVSMGGNVKILEAVSRGCLTPNQARRMLGLEEIYK